MARPAVYILYENEAWLAPLTDTLRARGIRYVPWFLHTGSFDVTQPPPTDGIFVSRCSASSAGRGHSESTARFRIVLAWLHAHGRVVINGLEGCELEISKARQYIRLQAAGIAVPSYRVVVGGRAALHAAVAATSFPIVVKPNCGGRGDGVALCRTAAELRAHIDALASDQLSPDGVTLLQTYIQASLPRILRIELVAGRLLYAMNSSTVDGFRLCAADECVAPPPAATTPPPPKFTYRPDIRDDHPLVRQYAAFMQANGIDIAGFESIEDSDGRVYTYDVNVSTNYSVDVQREAGIDFYDRIADFFLLRMSKAFPNVLGSSCARL